MRSRLFAVLLTALTAAGLFLLDAPSALAHGGPTPGVVTVAQTLGGHELTVTMYPPADGAGPMPVRIVAQGGAPDGPMLLRAVPGDGPGAGSPTSRTVIAQGTGSTASGTLQIDRPGAWEIVLIGRSDDIARIPLSVPAVPPTPLWAWLVRAGLVVAAVGAIATSALWVRRRWTALALGAVAAVGAAVAGTAALLSTSIAAPDPATVAASHSHASAGMSAMGMSGMHMPAAGSTAAADTGSVVVTPTARRGSDGLVEIGLRLTDGSTGAPVDDLVIHDDALVHLAVVGPGNRLWHVHPVRIAPGRFSVRLPLPDPGRYGLFAEMVRAGAGHQMTRSAFAVDAAPGVVLPPMDVAAAGGSGPREVAGMRVDVTLPAAIAGRDSRLELAFSENGQPVRDLQAWLGMGGHLMVLGPSAIAVAPDPTDPAVSFAHIHDMDAPVQYGYGPVIDFTYAFPTSGRYQLWAQVQRDWRLITIPITVDVAPARVGA
jgi:hypothetical protein